MQNKDRARLGMGALAMAGLVACSIAGMQSSMPAKMVGEWRWGTINPTTFYDKSNGAYLGHGGGMSCTFVFNPDGTYHKFFYVESTPAAGWTTKIWSDSEGKVVVEGDMFRLKPTKGHYVSKDTQVKKYNFERAMTEADLKNEAATKYRWSLTSGTDGKPVMVIAPGGTGQGSQFRKEK